MQSPGGQAESAEIRPTGAAIGRGPLVARALVAAGPILYIAALLVWQVRADWAVWREPGLDLETALALTAAAYLGLQLATYWRKPPALVSRRDWRAVVATALAIDALGLSVGQPITQPDALPMGLALTLAGTLLAFWSVIHLGRSFSLLPQARHLVTTGPYRYVRHPIYLGGLLITLAEVWIRFSPLVVALNVLFVGAQIVRLRYEESVLETAFPEYASYRTRTPALIPGIA